MATNPRASAEQAGQQVQRSKAYGLLVTLGLVCYGVIHLLLGWLSVQVAFGGGGGETSTGGALKDLVAKPFGNVLMIIFAIGLLALTVWQLLEAALGHRDKKTTKKVRKRISSAGRAITYAALGVTALRLAIAGRSGGGSQDGAQSASATLMAAPMGQLLVGVVGLVIIGIGVSQVVKGIRRKFATEDLQPSAPEWAKKLGTIGWIVKGVAIGLVGGLFCWAAVTADSSRAGGMDAALKALKDQPFGMVLLVVMGLGFACFGIYCLVWSRHVNHENL
ncbi:DUF1206 domain-containing protein [Microlunatus sp. Y2014]|uniref:DUF1206 domain-containing protein n=1 Tax=Microlunatus sp. Y2014 TaxID=3418488 RepID=UPI003DA78F25